MHFLATAYSFEGRYDDAIEAARELLGYKENPAQAASPDAMATAQAQGWFAMLRTLVQFEKWDAVLDEQMLPPYNKPAQEAWRHWARGIAYAAKGDIGGRAAGIAGFRRRDGRF